MKANCLSFLVISTLSFSAWGATLNFSGHMRSEAGTYNNLGLGLAGKEGSKNFISSRALLQPNLVIDDHFSVKSQWNLLTSPRFTADPTRSMSGGQGGWLLGDPDTAALVLNRAWLEWTSDIGVFRLGRMPVSWGYGVLYDSGDGIWDDFQSTLDRIEYRLHLGYVVGAIAYSKGHKRSVLDNDNDQEFYSGYLRYDNPEVEVEAGLLFEKQQRSATQSTELRSSPLNPHFHAAADYPIALDLPSPLSINVVDVYLKKTSGFLTYGGEVSWLSGTAVDQANMNAFGVLLNATLNYRKVKAFIEFLYATGDSNLADGDLTGFTLLHRNRRPGLILGRELVGPYYGNNFALGSPLAYGNAGAFSGALIFRPGVRLDWSPSLTSAVELIVARKAATQPGESAGLGVEIDVGTEYALYKNFRVGLDVGFLAPGDGLQVVNPGAAFAVRGTAALTF